MGASVPAAAERELLGYAIDASKMDTELDWRPLETFESGLRKTVQWYLANQIWVNNIKNGKYQSWMANTVWEPLRDMVFTGEYPWRRKRHRCCS